ncbi:MAG: ABC transporter ATP-binding protein, partial [Acidobacteria bacterium]|nr:ABC transporter ATP-binding protein [Acidobacteriota bacterium]
MQLFPIRDLRRLVRLGQFRGRLFGLALGLALLETWFSLWVPLLTRDLIEGEGIRTPLLVRMALALVAQALAAGLCHFVLGVLGANLVYNIRRVLTQHMLRLPVPFFDQHRSGELVSRVVADTDNLKSVLADHLVPFLSGLVLMLGSIVVLGYLDWKMTMVLLAAVLIAFIAMVPVAVQLNRIGKDTQSAAAQFSGRLTEVFREIRLVKAYNAVHMEGQKAAEGVGQLRNWGIQTAKVQALMSPLVSIVLMGAMVVILGYGALRVQQGSL